MIFPGYLGMVCHGRARLGAEILNDQLLDVPVLLLQLEQGVQVSQAIFGSLSNPQKQTSCEWDAQFTCGSNRSLHTSTGCPEDASESRGGNKTIK